MKAILLLVLSAVILSQSYGAAYAVHVSGHLMDEEPEVPIITIETDYSVYEEGEVILISGSVSDFREMDAYTNFDVTIRVLAPNNNIIHLTQVSLESDGSYVASILTGGPLWKLDGGYTILASQGPDRNASVIFNFVHSAPEAFEEEVVEEIVEEVIEVSEEELAEKCGEGTHLEDDVCVLDESSESETVHANTGSVPTEGFNSWIYSITFTLLIAFVIAISLFLISRVRGKKTV